MTDVIDAFAYGIEDADGGIAVEFYARDGEPVVRLFIELAAIGDFIFDVCHYADIAHRALRSWDQPEARIGDGVPAGYINTAVQKDVRSIVAGIKAAREQRGNEE